MILPSEGFRTVATLEGRLPGVLANVVDEVFAPREGLRAEVAAVGRLTRVLTHVV